MTYHTTPRHLTPSHTIILLNAKRGLAGGRIDGLKRGIGRKTMVSEDRCQILFPTRSFAQSSNLVINAKSAFLDAAWAGRTNRKLQGAARSEGNDSKRRCRSPRARDRICSVVVREGFWGERLPALFRVNTSCGLTGLDDRDVRPVKSQDKDESRTSRGQTGPDRAIQGHSKARPSPDSSACLLWKVPGG